MKHKIGFNRLSRTTSHRKAMLNNMITSLMRHERITTTLAKALELRRAAEKMVTRAKIDSVHNRREVAKRIKDKEILNKLFTEISVRFSQRPGGYTRILKMGKRQNDAADMAIIEFVEKKEDEKKKKKNSKKSVEKKEAVEKTVAKDTEEQTAVVEEVDAVTDNVNAEEKEE